MTVTLVQDDTGFAPGGTLNDDVTMGGAVTRDNLLLYGIAGDKNSGTVTIDGGAFALPINLRTADVSLILGVKTADGTESVIPCTLGANAGGSNMWCGEFQDPDSPGVWRTCGSATNNSDGTAQLIWSSGTTAAATGDALAIAVFSVDSVNVVPVPSYTNGFTAILTPSSGGNQAALWVAGAYVTRGQTVETTLDRDPGGGGGATADQMSGAVYLFSRAPVVPPQVVGSYGSFR